MFLVDVDNHPRKDPLGPDQDRQLEQGSEQQRDQGGEQATDQAEEMGRPYIGAKQTIEQGIWLQITVFCIKEEDGVILNNIIFHSCGGAEQVEEFFQRHHRTYWLLAILARVAGHAPLLLGMMARYAR